MTYEEFCKVKSGDKLRVINTVSSYKIHFAVGDVLTVIGNDNGNHVWFKTCPIGKCSPSCGEIRGGWGAYQNFELYEDIVLTPEELASASELPDPASFERFFGLTA